MLPTSIENAYLSRDSCTYFNCLVELAEVNFNSCLYYNLKFDIDVTCKVFWQ